MFAGIYISGFTLGFGIFWALVAALCLAGFAYERGRERERREMRHASEKELASRSKERFVPGPSPPNAS